MICVTGACEIYGLRARTYTFPLKLLVEIRYDPFASVGAALPNGWKLLFREANRADSEPRARQSQQKYEKPRAASRADST